MTNGQVDLLTAAAAGDLTSLKYVCEHTPGSINSVTDEYTQTALHLAICHVEAIELLIDARASLNSCSKDGSTALFQAAALPGACLTVAALLRANADVNRANLEGHTPLHAAARGNNASAIEVLLKANADVKLVDNQGKTALSEAARCSDEGTVRLLVEGKSDLNQADGDGNTPFDIADRRDDASSALVKELLQNPVQRALARCGNRTVARCTTPSRNLYDREVN